MVLQKNTLKGAFFCVSPRFKTSRGRTNQYCNIIQLKFFLSLKMNPIILHYSLHHLSNTIQCFEYDVLNFFLIQV